MIWILENAIFDRICNINNISYEIGDIKWVKFNEAIDLIRPYHIDRKKIINEVIQFLANHL
jgi:hypothetical protein